jgi:propionate CoA-transferase
VTERCVFRLTTGGIELIEAAPGIDIERAIFACMGFRPIVRNVRPMDARLFLAQPMNLNGAQSDVTLADRLTYDGERNTLFMNLEGLQVRFRADVDAIENVVAARCTEIGHPVSVVVNYDAFRLDEDVAREYADMVHRVEQKYYTRLARYMANAFMRVKLSRALTRTIRAKKFGSALPTGIG